MVINFIINNIFNLFLKDNNFTLIYVLNQFITAFKIDLRKYFIINFYFINFFVW